MNREEKQWHNVHQHRGSVQAEVLEDVVLEVVGSDEQSGEGSADSRQDPLGQL
jgi:hypothetical protein